MDQPKTEESGSQISLEPSSTLKDKNEQPSTASLISESEPAESPTLSPEPEKPVVKAKAKADDSEEWRNENMWVMMFCHHQLASYAQSVTLEYTSVLAGKKMTVRIPRNGVWVWVPDANKVLELQHLASCRGQDRSVNRPFFVGNPSERQKLSRPFGPPEV